MRNNSLLLLGISLEVLFVFLHVVLDGIGHREFSNTHLLTIELVMLYACFPAIAAGIQVFVIKKTKPEPCIIFFVFMFINVVATLLLLFRGPYALELLNTFWKGLVAALIVKTIIQFAIFAGCFYSAKKIYLMYMSKTGKGF